MNHINFIRSLNQSQQKEIYAWFRLTIILCGALLLMGLAIIGLQWHLYRKLVQEHATLQEKVHHYDSVMGTHRTTKQEQEQLQKKIMKLHRYHHNPKNPIEVIRAITAAVKQNPIESLSIREQTIELKIITPSSTQAMEVVQALQSSPLLKQVNLQSLHTNNHNQLITTIKAAM